jgi:hypothetical protein
MRALRLAIETQKWELAAHALIPGAITARQKEYGRNRREIGTKRKKWEVE